MKPERLEAGRRKLGVFEMSCNKKMFKIEWGDRVTNEKVLDRIKEERTH